MPTQRLKTKVQAVEMKYLREEMDRLRNTTIWEELKVELACSE